MTFAEAVAAMVAGERVSRPRKFRDPEPHYLNPDATKDHPAFLINEGGVVGPWTPTLADMEADDWEIYVQPAPEEDGQGYQPPATANLIKGA